MPEPRLRASLLIAGAGAVLVLVDLAGTGGTIAGLALIVLGLALTAPARPQSGSDQPDWWRLLRAGAALVAAGLVVGLVVESIGGLLAAAGAVLAVVATALGMP